MAAVSGFPMPQSLVMEEHTATDTYAKFIAAPFQSGFGHTIGNSLRRVLLSSLEGSAISAVRIEGVSHEFTTLPNVAEDITEIILNLKKVKLNLHTDPPKTLEIKKSVAGPVTAGDIITGGTVEVLNRQIICTLTRTFLSGRKSKSPEQGWCPVKRTSFRRTLRNDSCRLPFQSCDPCPLSGRRRPRRRRDGNGQPCS